MNVDVVLPYINGNISEYDKYRKLYPGRMEKSRYEPSNTLKYVFRSIDKYLPWIRNIYFIITYKEEIPEWLNLDSVKIIYPNEYIPQLFLPTLNSNCIQSYMSNIPGLSDFYLDFCDDILVTQPIKENELFKDGKCLFNMTWSGKGHNIWFNGCENSIRFFRKTMPIIHRIFVPSHLMTPEDKNFLQLMLIKYKDIIESNNTTLFRELCNFVRFFDYCAFFNHLLLPSALKEKYVECYSEETLNMIAEQLYDETYKAVCLNYIHESLELKITDLLEQKYPFKSKYEN